MIPMKEQIIRRLEDLPEPSLHKVLDFVEFLAWKQNNNGQDNVQLKDDPILAVAGTLSFPPLTNEQIDQELYGNVYVDEETQ